MRDKLLKELYKLRKEGWERPILPYGLPFREDSATDHELDMHIYKIKNYKRETIHKRIIFALQLIGIAILLIIIILNNMMKN